MTFMQKSEVYIVNIKSLALLHTEAIDMLFIIIFQELCKYKI